MKTPSALLPIMAVLWIYNPVSAQSIAPFTINVGGGIYASGYYQFDWNIGEGASIATFQGDTAALLVTTGSLQPFTEKAETNNLLSAVITSKDVKLFPVPTHAVLEVDLKMDAIGKVTLHVLDQAGHIVLTKQVDYYRTNSIQKLDLTNLTNGLYYLNILLEATAPVPGLRKGSFSIMKY